MTTYLALTIIVFAFIQSRKVWTTMNLAFRLKGWIMLSSINVTLPLWIVVDKVLAVFMIKDAAEKLAIIIVDTKG